MNVPKKLAELKSELKEEGVDVELLLEPAGVSIIGPYRERCIARAILKEKGVVCAPVIVEDYESEVPR